MVRKQSYAFVRICVPSCQTTPVIEYKFNKMSRFFKLDNLFRMTSNDREQQNYLGGYGLSFRNIEEHKHIDKRLYTNIERMTLNIWFSRL